MIRATRNGQSGVIIFRMTRKNPKTGKLERRRDGKPWVIFISDEESGQMQLAL